MRIQFRDLKNHLQKGLASLYLIFGEEPLQHKEALDAIRLLARKNGYLEREVFDITQHFNWESLLQSLETQSLFSSKRLIECYLHEGKLGKLGGDAIIKILNMLPKETLILFIGSKLDAATQTTKWFTTLENKAISICARNLAKEESLGFLMNRLAQHHLTSTKEIVAELYERTEGNLLSAVQSIEKLALTYLKNESDVPTEIKSADIQELNDDARFSLFDLVDAMLSGETLRTTRILTCLKNEGIEPILILWAITREVRAIIKLAYEVKKGRNVQDVLNEQKVWKQRAGLIIAFLRKFQIPTLLNGLSEAKKIDEVLKGRKTGDAWHHLQKLCLMFTEVSHV